MNSRTYVWYQWALGLLLNCVDYYTTKCYTTKVGIDGEFNPFMHKLIELFGINSLLYCKMGWFLFLALLILIVSKKIYWKIGNALVIVNVFTGAVVGWGLYCLLSSI
jgi:hypothetical protein